MADNGHPTQYDPRAQAMEEVHFDWRCIVCCMVALSPLHLEQQHLPGTESVYFDLDNTPWIKCDKCHTPFHLQCGTWESVYVVRSKCFLCTFFVVDSFRSPCHLCFCYSPPFPMSLVFQMPPSLHHVTCVLFMYPNHLILRWVVNECVQIQKKRRRCHPSDTPLRKGRRIEGIWPIPTNG